MYDGNPGEIDFGSRVSARFGLARVRVIGSRLYFYFFHQAKVSFIKNSARLKGAAIYISSLGACLWYEKSPFYSVDQALRWNNTFVYEGNYLRPGKHFQPFSGTEYDIATDTHHFEDEDKTDKEIQVKNNLCIL